MAENEIDISITTESDLKAVDQLIARMKHMREEIGKMSKGLKIGSEFAKEINQAIAANKKLEGSVKSLARTQAAAQREEEKGDRAYIQMHRRMIRENDQLARTEKRRQQTVDNMTRSYSGLTLSLKKAASLSSGLMKTLNQQESVARRLTAVEKERAKAETNLANAKKKYDDLIRKGGASQQELHDAKELLALADRQEKAVQARARAIKNEMTTLNNAKEAYDRLGETIKKIEASGKKAPEQLVRQYHALG
jgi:prefoldin subunit 5